MSFFVWQIYACGKSCNIIRCKGDKEMDISIIINKVISLFLIILVGVYGSKKKIINEEVNKGLSSILLNITLPIMIISSFLIKYDEEMKSNVIKAFFYSGITIIASIFISYIFLKPIKSKNKFLLQFANVFSNCGFVGFPIIGSIYGAEGVIYTSIFNMFFTILVWTYGILLFTGKINIKEIKKVLVNPSVIAVYIGIVLFIFKIDIPEVITSTMDLVGAVTTPLSMIIVGVILSHISFKKYMSDWTVYYSSLLKLIITPLALFMIFKILKIHSVLSNTMVLLTAMPTAAITSILAENLNKEKEYATILVFISTVLSLVTFPLIAYVAI